jgi:hypothetical protein
MGTADYPCLSDDGQWMLYMLEEKEGENSIRTVRLMNISDGTEKEIFRPGNNKGLPPFEEAALTLGTKPPLLSGDGKTAVFTLSLGEPANILDHYLGVVEIDTSELTLHSFPMDSLEGKDWGALDLLSQEWERVSNYAISRDGNRIACAVKGHLGPRKYGNPSGIILIDRTEKKQRTLLAPELIEREWNWSKFPRQPLTGGGWAFCLSGNGKKIIFGAQNSTEKTDYDLYSAEWDSSEINRITDFQDRWFSQADTDYEGSKVVFYYSGKKKHGIGTYMILIESSELSFLQSPSSSQIEFYDMSENGQKLIYKEVYDGRMLSLNTDKDELLFDAQTSGYASGIFPMDFPRFPSFWMPEILNSNAERILLIGPPQGRETPEIYILEKKR